MKIILAVFGSMFILAIGGYIVFGGHETESDASHEVQPTTGEKAGTFDFKNPTKSTHFESSTPAHGTVFPVPPINIVLDFNIEVTPASSLSVMHAEEEYTAGDLEIDGNKLAMRRIFNPAAPDGLYRATYRACGPDGSCQEGYFQFAIDRTTDEDFMNHLENTHVVVSLKNARLSLPNIRIAPNTIVTWHNDDTTSHSINSDSHPAHTYYAPQNSPELNPGDKFQTEFTTPGAYPYHCSLHPGEMRGMIIIEKAGENQLPTNQAADVQ